MLVSKAPIPGVQQARSYKSFFIIHRKGTQTFKGIEGIFWSSKCQKFGLSLGLKTPHFCSKVHDIGLQAVQGNVLTVEDLVKKIYDVTEIPPANQKILFKGKTLNKDPEAYLTDIGLTDHAKVMLLGKKPDPLDDKEMGRLHNIEQSMKKEEEKLSEVTYELDGIHRGFLDNSLKGPALQKSRKRVAHTIEQYMKLLETLDSLSLDESNSGGRAKRKSLVNRIQNLLDRCDGLAKGIEDMLASNGDKDK
ncbi:BAG family molecular chaperone regulator 1-like isoform X2 [Ostrea edulis]|uniref:BAG family molecular chaperone regulator 1-like isoform X2 n=1 Tax=Ostrea edulis TaxID=37623 RepID=UPI0024AFD0E8|nr:BAG family molecular chaperone regulator 1-like isoform X2 [Ostrea edulis]